MGSCGRAAIRRRRVEANAARFATWLSVRTSGRPTSSSVGQLGVFGWVNGRPLLGDKGEQKTVAANAYRALAASASAVDLQPSPITPDWILASTLEARSKVLAKKVTMALPTTWSYFLLEVLAYGS
jgi:hypothetical protein